MRDSSRDQLEPVQSLEHVLKILTPREEKMIKMRYGFGPGGVVHSVKTIAFHFDVSESLVYKKLSRALKKLQPVLSILESSQRSAQELTKAAQILRNAKRKGATTEEIYASIRTQLPELSSLADVLPRNRTELYAFIQLILTAIMFLIASFVSKDGTQVTINRATNVINQFEQEQVVNAESLKSKQHHRLKSRVRKRKSRVHKHPN